MSLICSVASFRPTVRSSRRVVTRLSRRLVTSYYPQSCASLTDIVPHRDSKQCSQTMEETLPTVKSLQPNAHGLGTHAARETPQYRTRRTFSISRSCIPTFQHTVPLPPIPALRRFPSLPPRRATRGIALFQSQDPQPIVVDVHITITERRPSLSTQIHVKGQLQANHGIAAKALDLSSQH